MTQSVFPPLQYIIASIAVAMAPLWCFLCPRESSGAFTFYDLNNNGGLAGFNSDAGSPPVTLDFEGIAANSGIGGDTIDGITFTSSSASPLIVVRGADTFTPGGFNGVVDASTNKLFPTTGEMVLSPGGTNLRPGPDGDAENDDLELIFQIPVIAFGMDFLFQSADGDSNTSIIVFNQLNSPLYSGPVPAPDVDLSLPAGDPGGSAFWGGIATGIDRIARIVIDENDQDNQYPDSNIGVDSFRVLVPEPTTLTLAILLVFSSLLFRHGRHPTL